jgi:hypothetical protein
MSEPDIVADSKSSARRAGEESARKVFGCGGQVLALVAFVLVIVIGYLGVQFVSAVKTAFGPIYVETSRVTSEDGRVDAVVVKNIGGGAMTGISRYVFVVEARADLPKPDHAVFHSSQTDDLKVEWTGGKSLAITYKHATIEHFRNYAYPLGLDNTPYKIQITETHVRGSPPDDA